MRDTKTWFEPVAGITTLLKNCVILMMVFSLAGAPETALAQNSAPAKAKPAAAKSSAAPESGGGPHDTVKVHGHWVIDVRNPDGSLASHTEFENSLAQGKAMTFLASLLSRSVSVGFWSIEVGSNVISEPNNPFSFASSTNLAVSGTATALQLAGSVTAAQDSSIVLVSTMFVQCAPTANPNTSCTSPVGGTFTSHLLAQPVSVVSGQIIQVTVSITFS